MGLFYGALVGLPVGLANGLVLAALAEAFSFFGHPRERAAAFRTACGAACAVLSASLAGAASHPISKPDEFFDGGRIDFLAIVVPAFLAALAMGVSGALVAGRYLREDPAPRRSRRGQTGSS